MKSPSAEQQVEAMVNWLEPRRAIEWVWIAPHERGIFMGRAAKITRKEAAMSKPTKKKGMGGY